MDEILEATPAGLLEETKEIVEEILTLPALVEQIDSLQQTVSALVVFDLILLIAVVFLLYKNFKK